MKILLKIWVLEQKKTKKMQLLDKEEKILEKINKKSKKKHIKMEKNGKEKMRNL